MRPFSTSGAETVPSPKRSCVSARRENRRARGVAAGKQPIPVVVFDGTSLPLPDASRDVVLFADVLHHTRHAESSPPRGVPRGAVGGRNQGSHGRGLPRIPYVAIHGSIGNSIWGLASAPISQLGRVAATVRASDVDVTNVNRRIGLYPWPLGLVFERSLHFRCAVVVLAQPVNEWGDRPHGRPRS